ncbi:hypothetical protein RD792_003704 [Penstemon davidsonii]|uniref:Protein LURP-one-related 8 n=1 Tax=Penstemon davidsonii TaxID=160366 RepID=A0ABR0DFF6_9LAMI|nr:hypothetical protein RD792_003704 [Penstemon davidsonii]
MTKVYPNAASSISLPINLSDNDESKTSTVLTVWKKSLLFNCDGFTVFDAAGNLVYRVDNYTSGNKGQIVLMDGSGKSLLTIRRKKLSLGDSWLVFDGETAENPRFLVKKNVNLLKTKCLAHVISTGGCQKPVYEIEGCYSRRICGVYDDKRRRVMEIKPKESSVRGVAFGMDIFRLVVQPGFDMPVAMAILIILDKMF